MQILVCDDNPYMVKRLADLIGEQIALQGIAATLSIISNTEDLHHLDYTAFDLAFLDVVMVSITVWILLVSCTPLDQMP
mgnify:CR=1 FL=1